MYPQLRAYLLGLLDLRLGDRAGAEGGAAALDSLSRAAAALGAAGEQGRELARGMAEGLRGQLAAARGERDEALARLERARLTVSEGLLESSFGAQAQERWTRAELLREAGRLDEALRWYAGLGGVAIDFLPYRAPAALRQAEIYERLGDRRRAAERYAQAVALWRDAEPELQPLVRRARERLAALR
jgi:tetratricopeptide (TPR) repeat protein